MKKLITVLALVLLFTASTQAATILMDEDFDSATGGVDLSTLAGWTASGVAILTASPVDGGTMGIQGAAGSGLYSYALTDSGLAAGEFYRFEAYLDIPDTTNGAMVHLQVSETGLAKHFQIVLEDDGTLTQDVYISSGGGSGSRARVMLPSASSYAIRARLDISASGIVSSYDDGSGWQALGSTAVGASAPLVNMRAYLWSAGGGGLAGTAQADTISVVVLPEPATLAVLALGGFAVLLRRKR